MDKEKIIKKHFQRSFLGYDVEEVDAFLDDIIRDIDRREQELGIARLRIKILLEELENRGLIGRKGGEAVPGNGKGAEKSAHHPDAGTTAAKTTTKEVTPETDE